MEIRSPSDAPNKLLALIEMIAGVPINLNVVLELN
jgi:hypothetical protein